MSVSILREKIAQVKSHVPWFNKAEWEEVAKRAYSDDLSLKNAAYNQMCVWKARNPKLPLGVECTMAILYVQLSDNIYMDEKKQQMQLPHSEKDLQLMYCTAIMRFVNHLKSLSDNERSLYTMAHRHNIPEWIINLRHETAHGNTLPSLCLLRSAALVILQWLGEHYWQAEALHMEDYILEVKAKKNLELSDIAFFFKVWLSARVYEWGGIVRIDQLPNEELRIELLRILELYSSDDGDSQHNLTDSLASDDYNNGTSEPEESDSVEQHRLKDVMQIILNKMSDFFNKLKGKKYFLKKFVIDKLMENRGFLSSDVFLEEESPVNIIEEEVISVLAHLWYDVLKIMDSKCMTYDLLKALVRVSQNNDSVDRSRMAALWVCQLAKMFLRHRSQHRNYWHIDGASNIENMYMLNLLKNVASSLENDLCSNVHPILMDYLSTEDLMLPTLSLHHLKNINKYQLERFVKEVALNPNKFTSFILPGLLDICGKCFSKKTKQELLTIVSVYTNGPKYDGSNGFIEDSPNSDSVKTIEMLRVHEGLKTVDVNGYCCEDMNNVSPDSESEREEENTEPVKWVPYSGNEDWSKCALGITPWQRKAIISSAGMN